MPNPRKVVAFDEIGILTATYLIDGVTITYNKALPGGSAAVGLAATLSADDTIALTADGDAVIGKILSVDADGVATVQVGGFCTLPAGNGATVTRGKSIVGALGASSAKGYVREVNTAVAAELGKANGMLHRVGTTTALVVKF